MTRLITATLLASLVIAAIYELPPPLAGAIFATFLVLGAWEWTRLIGWESSARRFAYIAVLALCSIAIWRWNETSSMFFYVQLIALTWWSAVALLIACTRHRAQVWPMRLCRNGFTGLLVLLPAWSAVVWLLRSDPTMLLVLFVVVWSADGGAYFCGRKWGKRRLAPAISPGKTWAGVVGGLLASIAAALVFCGFVILSVDARIGFIIVVIATFLASVVGDLFESAVKRYGGFKDSGNLLPGHGGVLDRIDGFLAAAPIFASGFAFWVNQL